MLNKLTAALVLITASSAFAQTYPGNGGSGFGGPIGQGSLTLSDDGTTVTGTITRGAGGFNDALVIYLDTMSGGVTDTTTLTDSADYLRRSISGTNGSVRASLFFPTGFDADFAIAMTPSTDANFGGLWNLSPVGNFAFVSSVGLTPNNSTTATTYTFTFNLADIGSPTSFDFVTTYLNANSVYRSNEAFGNTLTGNAADANGNFGQNDATAGNANTYLTAAVPEPSTLTLLAGPALLGGWMFLRRRRA